MPEIAGCAYCARYVDQVASLRAGLHEWKTEAIELRARVKELENRNAALLAHEVEIEECAEAHVHRLIEQDWQRQRKAAESQVADLRSLLQEIRPLLLNHAGGCCLTVAGLKHLGCSCGLAPLLTRLDGVIGRGEEQNEKDKESRGRTQADS